MEQGGEHTHNVCNREEAQQRGVTHAFPGTLFSFNIASSLFPLPQRARHRLQPAPEAALRQRLPAVGVGAAAARRRRH